MIYCLLIEETLDAHLRRFLEWLVHQLHLGYLAVDGQRLVGGSTYLLGYLSLRLLVDIIGYVGIDEGHELSLAVDHQRLYDIRTAGEHCFQLFGIDVLA